MEQRVGPKTLGTLTFKLAHPEFLPAEIDLSENEESDHGLVTARSLLARQAEFALEPGFIVQGQATTTDGKPLADARIVVATGENLETRQTRPTGSDGRFRVVMIEATEGQILVQARGFVPQQRSILIDRELEPLQFKLAPSRLIRGRVLDGENQPVPAATVHLTTMGRASALSLLDWRATTDAEGRFTCDGVPSGGFGFYATKPGYGSPTFQALDPAAEGEIVVRLERSFQITGRVTDADTGQPLKQFKVIPGRTWGDGEDNDSNPVQWETYRQLEGVDGSCTMPFEDQGGGQYKLLVVAEGYLPAMTRSSPAAASAPTTSPSSQAKGPRRRRRPRRRTRRRRPGRHPRFRLSVLERASLQSAGGDDLAVTRTDAQGHFSLRQCSWPRRSSRSTNLVMRRSMPPTYCPRKIQLQPWGRVEGVMMSGPVPPWIRKSP